MIHYKELANWYTVHRYHFDTALTGWIEEPEDFEAIANVMWSYLLLQQAAEHVDETVTKGLPREVFENVMNIKRGEDMWFLPSSILAMGFGLIEHMREWFCVDRDTPVVIFQEYTGIHDRVAGKVDWIVYRGEDR
jgi:hypothetical protein